MDEAETMGVFEAVEAIISENKDYYRYGQRMVKDGLEFTTDGRIIRSKRSAQGTLDWWTSGILQ